EYRWMGARFASISSGNSSLPMQQAVDRHRPPTTTIMSQEPRVPRNLKDYEILARTRLPAGVVDYFARGAADEFTLRDNDTCWNQLRLRPRVGIDVSKCDLRTTILGQEVSMPVMTAPCAVNAMAHPDGELAVAR